MELTAYRERFPILAETTYLINHSLGAMPAAVAEPAGRVRARPGRRRGVRAWGEGWWTMPLSVGDQVGRIIGAAPGTTVMHQNVAVAEAVVLSCFLPAAPGRNRVVYEAENFPSVRYLYQAQPGLEVVVCADVEEILATIDERTLLVPISHVLFRSGEIQDVAAITAAPTRRAPASCSTATSRRGSCRSTSSRLGVDFAVGGSVKWLCGGPGNGWLYVRPDLDRAARGPTLVGWQAHADAVRLRAGAALRRGVSPASSPGRPNVPALYAATPGYDLIEEVGVERIRANSLRQTAAPDRARPTTPDSSCAPRASRSDAAAP